MSRRNHIWEAIQAGRPHGITVATCQERADPRVPGVYTRVYVVYQRHVRMGKRRDPAAALRLVKELIQAHQAYAQGSGSHAPA